MEDFMSVIIGAYLGYVIENISILLRIYKTSYPKLLKKQSGIKT